MRLIVRYFLLAVLFIGTIGIWGPIVTEIIDKGKVDSHNVPPNMITYYIAIIFTSSIDFFLVLLKKEQRDTLPRDFINVLTLILLAFGSALLGTFLHLKKYDFCAYFIGSIGILVSWRVWWIVNVNNDSFKEDIKPSNATPPAQNLNGSTAGFNV